MDRSYFSGIELAPPDPILGLTDAFNADTNPSKINLGVGVYQDAKGKVPVLGTVRKAEARWYEAETSKTYLSIEGVSTYNRAVQELILGAGSGIIADGRAVTFQAPGGTGALRIGADFLRRFFPESGVWICNPSWENHRQLFTAAGFVVNSYPYYDAERRDIDIAAMTASLKSLPPRSIVLLHACCHNPTGVDPTPDHWEKIVSICRERELIPFIDMAYQGFGEGIAEDAHAISRFADSGISCLIASSFSKSMSLYRERVGALTVITGSPEEAKHVQIQVKRVIRTLYSNPASHGAQVAALILTDPELRDEWENEVKEMRERIHSMRHLFVKSLENAGVDRDFSFILRQKGMFSYSGLSRDIVLRLRKEFGLYMVDSGRICVAAMNENNVPIIARAIAGVLK